MALPFFDESSESVFIPKDCKEIPDKCFVRCKALSRVTFAEGCVVRRFGSQAFKGLSLVDIEIPASVEEIGDGCFSECSSLARVTFASGSVLKRIGEEAFAECEALETIQIPASVEEIGNGCFWCVEESNFNPASIVFESGSVLKHIGKCAFQWKNISELKLPDENPFFIVSAPFIIRKEDMCLVCIFLDNWEGFTEVEIPANVKELGEWCFYMCRKMWKVTFASGSVLRRIGARAFEECDMLGFGPTEFCLEIPASVEEIGKECFSCEGGASIGPVIFAAGSRLKRIEDYAFDNCENLTEIEIPATVEYIGDGAFQRCRDFGSVTFASGSVLKHIGDNAFERTMIEEIEISASVEELGEDCFNWG